MNVTREVRADGWCVRLDLSRQVLSLEVPEVYSDHRKSPLSPVLPQQADGPTSAATLLLKAKQFDDRLYAAVELAAQQGAGHFAGKAWLLRSLTSTLAGRAESVWAAATVHAACELGGVSVADPAPEVAAAARALVADFVSDPFASKPIAFYTWTPELKAIFRQDRFLQRPLSFQAAEDLARAAEQTPGAPEALAAILRLNARLTNPAKPHRDPLTAPPLLPPSRSHEITLFERLLGDRPVPEGFDLMAELIRRVRSGDVSLAPAKDAGWYDRTAWSLEPLIVPGTVPEAGRLVLGRRYLEHLEDLFRGALALARETHVKALGGAGGYGGPRVQPISVRPDLTVEPLPSLYGRRAVCYRFVRSVLEEAFGPDALRQMQRLTPEATVAGGLEMELDLMENLFAGAAAVARSELGMPVSGADEAVRCFLAWRSALDADRDVSRDARMMVPVFYDAGRRKTKVWTMLGWRTTQVNVTYQQPPEIVAVSPEHGQAGKPPEVRFSGDWCEFAVPVTAEVYVTQLLDRDEFRRHCDRYRTREAILGHLR